MKIRNPSALTLRPYQPPDAVPLTQLFSDDETMRFMHVRPLADPAETGAQVAQDLQNGAEYWTICLRATREPVGFVSFLGGTRVPGMGYMLRRDLWGQGHTTSAMSAALDHAFNEKKLDRVELWINEANLGSRRVAEKLGFTIKGRIHQRYDWEETHHIMLVYGLWAAEWQPSIVQERRQPAFFGLQPVLVVPDVQATILFYTERLGFDVDFVFGEPPTHAGLVRGAWSCDSAALQVTRGPAGDPGRLQAWLYFMVTAQIDRLYEEYVRAGVEILRRPETHPWGMREFSVRDLNGYELRFGTRAAEPGAAANGG